MLVQEQTPHQHMPSQQKQQQIATRFHSLRSNNKGDHLAAFM
jgi:hypothetical protein